METRTEGRKYEEDLYNKLQELNKYLDFLNIQEDYIQEDQIKLKREELRSKEELKRIQAVPLVIGHFVEMID
jgi:26S proteasome regulatory subunit T3